MRTIKLSHDEIELIKNSLQYVYDKKLDIVKNNRKILGDSESKSIIDTANKYFDVAEKISNGDYDV